MDSYRKLGYRGGVTELADDVLPDMHFGNQDVIVFYIWRGSTGDDYKKAVKALKAIVELK